MDRKLSTPDALKQIKHMIGFIEQEGQEKIDEIEAKSEEEFTMEKARLVQLGRDKISDQYDKKEEELLKNERIEISNISNNSRLNLLRVRETSVNAILAEARARLDSITSKKEEYKTILKKLIIQGLFQLLEESVLIRCREVDVKMVEDLLPKCEEIAHDRLDIPVECEIDYETYLPPETKGGVELYADHNRIKVPNTLEARLDLVTYQLMPEIRVAIFGKNQNRKYFS